MNAIPTTARQPIEFIPTPQDVERYRNRRVEERKPLEQQAREDYQQGSDNLQASNGDVLLFDEETDATVERMRARYPDPATMLIIVPTAVEQDQINSRLTALGVSQISQELLRATMIDELFYLDWGTGTPDGDLVKAEEAANFMDGAWTRSDLHAEAMERWRAQEIERIADRGEGAPEREAAPLPVSTMTVRETARMNVILDRVMNESQRMKDVAARSADFDRIHRAALVRLHVVGVRDLATAVPIARLAKTPWLTVDQHDALREALDRPSYDSVIRRIDEMYRLPADEGKGFASPAARPSMELGSLAPSGDTSGNGGSSTSSDITHLHADVSAQTIDTLFEPGSLPAAEEASSAEVSPSQTVEV